MSKSPAGLGTAAEMGPLLAPSSIETNYFPRHGRKRGFRLTCLATMNILFYQAIPCPVELPKQRGRSCNGARTEMVSEHPGPAKIFLSRLSISRRRLVESLVDYHYSHLGSRVSEPIPRMSGPTTTPVSADNWTVLLPDTDHARAFTSNDWAATEIGALSTWCVELRLYTIQAFADVNPVCIWWY